MSWSLLQSNSTEGRSGATSACEYTAGLTAGSVMLAYATSYQDAVTGVTDGSGNSFALVEAADNTGAGGSTHGSVWALATPAGDDGTTPTVTFTFAGSSGAPYTAVMVEEVAGISAAPDGTPGAVGYFGAVSPVGPPSYASSAAGEFLAYFYGEDGYSASVTAPAGYATDPASLLTDTAVNANIGVAYADSTGGTESGQWTTTSHGTLLIMTAFPLSGGPPPVSPSGLLMASII